MHVFLFRTRLQSELLSKGHIDRDVCGTGIEQHIAAYLLGSVDRARCTLIFTCDAPKSRNHWPDSAELALTVERVADPKYGAHCCIVAFRPRIFMNALRERLQSQPIRGYASGKTPFCVVRNFVSTTKPYCGLIIRLKLLRVRVSLDFWKTGPIFVSLFVS